MATVKLSLMQSWIGSKDGSIMLRMGFTSPIVQDNAEGYGNRGQVIPGKEILVRLYPEEGKNAALVSDEWAKVWFGDWTAAESREGRGEFRTISGQRGQMRELIPTVAEEADRVASNWGDYRRRSERGMKQDHPEFPTGEVIGPAQVPHVLIESVDAAGVPDGVIQYDPWQFLGYDAQFEGFNEVEAGAKVLFDWSRRKV